MTEKRFVDGGFEAIEEQSFTDTLTNKTYYVDYFDEIIELCNNLNDENEQLKELIKDLKHEYDSLHDVCSKLEKRVKCIQEEANDYCEELMGKDEFIRLYKRQRDEVIEENEKLKQQRDFYYARLQKIIKIANGVLE